MGPHDGCAYQQPYIERWAAAIAAVNQTDQVLFQNCGVGVRRPRVMASVHSRGGTGAPRPQTCGVPAAMPPPCGGRWSACLPTWAGEAISPAQGAGTTRTP